MYYESPKLNYDYFIVCIDYICNGVSNGDNQIAEEPYLGTLDDRYCFFTRVLLSNGKIKIICNGYCD